MKYRIKIGAILLSICLMLPIFGMVANAASGKITISNVSGTVGSTVSVKCTIKCTSGPIGTADVVLVYDPAGLKYVSGTGGYSLTGGSGSVSYSGLTSDGTSTSLSFTMKFKILKAGSHSISVSDSRVYDIEEELFSPSGKGTVTGKTTTSNNNNSNNNSNNNTNNNTQQNNKDSNNKLNSLQVYPGTLSPAFSAGTKDYTVTIPGDTTEVTISATPQSSKANVTVSGGKDLKLGPNTAQVVVVAENGSSTAYNITIMCGEVEKIQVGSSEYTINESFTDEQIPTGFTKTEVTYKNRQYSALTNESNNVQLLYLQTGDESDYFIYDQDTQEFYPFAQVTISEGKYIVPLPLNSELTQFADSDTVSIDVQGKVFDAWKIDDEFSVAYVMNQDGVEMLYRYDSVDGVFQRYTGTELIEAVPMPMVRTLFPNDYYMYAIVGLGTLCFILMIAMIYFIASRKHRREARKRKAIKRAEKQKAKEEKQRMKEEAEREKQRLAEEKELEKQRAKDEKQRLKEEKKLEKQRRKER